MTGNLANKLASLTDAGPLMVHKENWLAVVGAAILPPPGANNLVPISYYVIEDILSAAWIKTLELRQHPMGYTITVDSVGQMLADLDAKGISWEPATSVLEMRVRVTRVALTLPAADRALDVSDINPFTAIWGLLFGRAPGPPPSDRRPLRGRWPTGTAQGLPGWSRQLYPRCAIDGQGSQQPFKPVPTGWLTCIQKLWLQV